MRHNAVRPRIRIFNKISGLLIVVVLVIVNNEREASQKDWIVNRYVNQQAMVRYDCITVCEIFFSFSVNFCYALVMVRECESIIWHDMYHSNIASIIRA